MKEKIINSLAIIFLAIACIFNSLSILKIKEQIQQNNNKIVETKGVKKAFENAPTKTNDLPSFNKEFKVYINITSLNDINNLLDYLNENVNDDQILFLGYFNAVIDGEEQLLAFLITYMSGTLTFTAGEERFSLNRVNGEIFSKGNNFTEEMVIPTFDAYNTLLSNFYVLSTQELVIDKQQTYTISNVLSGQNYIYGYDLKDNSIPSVLLGTITIIATGILNILISLFNNVIPIFWLNNAPTFVGTIVLFAVAIPITYWVINFVIGLIRKIRLTRGK